MLVRILILSILLAGCGPSHYLKKAERALKKAELKGATINRDTVWTTVKLTAPGASVKWEPRAVSSGTMVFIKDSIITKVIFRDSPGEAPDTVEVATDCPDMEVETNVPTVINTDIEAGYSLWDLIILSIICLAVGAIISRIFWK